jgi:hypothetical protein
MSLVGVGTPLYTDDYESGPACVTRRVVNFTVSYGEEGGYELNEMVYHLL